MAADDQRYLTLGQAGRPWDVLVVGAGPAGSLAARELARRGLEVLLVDRASFPRWKVCGCCLNGRALASLRGVGLGHLSISCGAVPLQEMRLAAGSRSARLTLTGGAALSRTVFDTALVTEAVRAGSHFLSGTRAVLESPGRIRLEQAERAMAVPARVVLAADGLGGQLLARAGVSWAPAAAGARIGAGVVVEDGPAFYGAGIVFMACGSGGYLGLVRLEDGRLNLAAALDPAWVRQSGGLGHAAVRLLGGVGWPVPEGLPDQPWRGTPALTRQAGRLAAPGVFALGDAAGYIEPFTGEGMAWALAGAVAVAPLAARAVSGHWPGLARAWTREYHRVVAGRQLACRAAAAVLRRPLLAGTLVQLLARVPALARPVVQMVSRH